MLACDSAMHLLPSGLVQRGIGDSCIARSALYFPMTQQIDRRDGHNVIGYGFSGVGEVSAAICFLAVLIASETVSGAVPPI